MNTKLIQSDIFKDKSFIKKKVLAYRKIDKVVSKESLDRPIFFLSIKKFKIVNPDLIEAL